MKIIELGHTYELANKVSGTQKLVFFKDLPKDSPDNHDGVLNQEVLRALVNRMIVLYVQKPCQESHEVILLLRQILLLMEKRAFGNTLEKVYSKTGRNIEEIPTCKNGHIFDLEL